MEAQKRLTLEGNIVISAGLFDQQESTESFESLRELVENIYTNEYLVCLLPA